MGATPRKLCSKGRTAIKPKFLVILGPSLDADRLSAHHQGKKSLLTLLKHLFHTSKAIQWLMLSS